MLKQPTNKQKTTNQYQQQTAKTKNEKERKICWAIVIIIPRHRRNFTRNEPTRKILNINDDDDDNVQFLPRVPGGNGRIQFLLIFVSFCYDFLSAERTASARSTSWPAWRRCSWTRRRKSLWSGAKCWGSKRACINRNHNSNIHKMLRFRWDTDRLRRKEGGERRYIFELQLFLIFKYCFSLVSSWRTGANAD